MTPEQAAALRAPFPAEKVGKLPKTTCGDCIKKQCKKHQKQKCSVCDAWISPAHIHLDFVGHGAITDRLLHVDPDWTWEPMGFGSDGSPSVVVHGKETSMWGRITVCGVTRPAVGTAASDSFELPKQLISDFLRNGAMRFGVALDLWSKEDLGSDDPPQTVRVSSDVWDQILAVSGRLSDEQKAAWKQAHPMGRDMPADLASKALEYGLALVGAETAGDAAGGESEPVLDPGRPFTEPEG